MTLMEIFYPIILMILCYLIKLAFNSTKTTWEDEGSLKEYLIDKGNFGFDYTIYPYLMAYNTFVKNASLCYKTIKNRRMFFHPPACSASKSALIHS